MKMQLLRAAGSLAVLSMLTSGAALAQPAKLATAATAPPPPAISYGPATPGLCTLSLDAAIGGSTVGKYVQTRINQIGTQVQSELQGEQSAINTEAKTLEGQKATLDQGSFDKKVADLQLRASALQRKQQLREKEFQATQQKALGRIYQEIEPVTRAAFQQSKCTLLFSRESMIIANPASDITQLVTTGLNAKITQFAFDREHLDQPALAPAPAR